MDEVNDAIYSNYFAALNLESKSILIHSLARFTREKLYNLNYKEFNFSKGIEGIMQNLKEHGPLSVIGCLGKPFYKLGSEKEMKIGDKCVFSFPPNSYTQEFSNGAHVIVLIGGKQKRL